MDTTPAPAPGLSSPSRDTPVVVGTPVTATPAVVVDPSPTSTEALPENIPPTLPYFPRDPVAHDVAAEEIDEMDDDLLRAWAEDMEGVMFFQEDPEVMPEDLLLDDEAQRLLLQLLRQDFAHHDDHLVV